MEQADSYPADYRFTILPEDRHTVIEAARQAYAAEAAKIEQILSGDGFPRKSDAILRIKAAYLNARALGANGWNSDGLKHNELLSAEVADVLTMVYEAAAQELRRQLPPAELEEYLFGALPWWEFYFLASLPGSERVQWELYCTQYWFYAYRANEQWIVAESASGETPAGKPGAAELLKAAYRWSAQLMQEMAADLEPTEHSKGTHTEAEPTSEPEWLNRLRKRCTEAEEGGACLERFQLLERAWRVHQIPQQARYLEALGYHANAHKMLRDWLFCESKQGSQVDLRFRERLQWIAEGELPVTWKPKPKDSGVKQKSLLREQRKAMKARR